MYCDALQTLHEKLMWRIDEKIFYVQHVYINPPEKDKQTAAT